MEIKLRTKTVAGLDRGGEDLFVRVTVEGDGARDEASFEEAWGRLLGGLSAEKDKREREADEIWVEDGRTECRSTHYDLFVDWSVEELKGKVRGVFLGGKGEEDLFVDGNAD